MLGVQMHQLARIIFLVAPGFTSQLVLNGLLNLAQVFYAIFQVLVALVGAAREAVVSLASPDQYLFDRSIGDHIWPLALFYAAYGQNSPRPVPYVGTAFTIVAASLRGVS